MGLGTNMGMGVGNGMGLGMINTGRHDLYGRHTAERDGVYYLGGTINNNTGSTIGFIHGGTGSGSYSDTRLHVGMNRQPHGSGVSTGASSGGGGDTSSTGSYVGTGGRFGVGVDGGVDGGIACGGRNNSNNDDSRMMSMGRSY